MSQVADAAAVQKIYAAFLSGDIHGVLNALADDVEWTVPGKADPAAGTYNGRAGVGQFFQRLAETFDFTGFEPRSFLAQGDQGAAFGWYSMTVKSTGRSVQSEWCHVWTFRDGKVTRFKEYTDTEAVAAGF